MRFAAFRMEHGGRVETIGGFGPLGSPDDFSGVFVERQYERPLVLVSDQNQLVINHDRRGGHAMLIQERPLPSSPRSHRHARYYGEILLR